MKEKNDYEILKKLGFKQAQDNKGWKQYWVGIIITDKANKKWKVDRRYEEVDIK